MWYSLSFYHLLSTVRGTIDHCKIYRLATKFLRQSSRFIYISCWHHINCLTEPKKNYFKDLIVENVVQNSIIKFFPPTFCQSMNLFYTLITSSPINKNPLQSKQSSSIFCISSFSLLSYLLGLICGFWFCFLSFILSSIS